ncbi:helix-turn-helix transcriptional regulator [Photobacterium sp. J15]|uniref:helix-turn-helix transcriptional regulator n=1 Tax=Photobacterium sp. J15 TaxID=265901 RepID=UPI000ACFA357|nr:AraC family transcriptional regulator [Photobacterium sp. J15]
MTDSTIRSNAGKKPYDSISPLLNIDKHHSLPESVFNTGAEYHEIIEIGQSVLNITTYCFSEIQIVIFEGFIDKEIEIPIKDNGEYLSLAFVKKGTIKTISTLCDFENIATAGTANLCHHHCFEGTAYFSPTEKLQIAAICLPKGYLTEFKTLLTHGNSLKAHGYMHIPMANNIPMQECVDMLFTPPVTGQVKQVFLKGKAYELISLSVQSMFSQSIPTSGVSEKEKHRIYKARDILENSLLNPPKLPVLARLIGTNDFQLKKDFKSVFNTSPHAYVIRRRMEKAYQSIINSDMPITIIAQNLGYNNASHFSSTFFKHYGVKPRDVKHLRKQGETTINGSELSALKD